MLLPSRSLGIDHVLPCRDSRRRWRWRWRFTTSWNGRDRRAWCCCVKSLMPSGKVCPLRHCKKIKIKGRRLPTRVVIISGGPGGWRGPPSVIHMDVHCNFPLPLQASPGDPAASLQRPCWVRAGMCWAVLGPVGARGVLRPAFLLLST